MSNPPPKKRRTHYYSQDVDFEALAKVDPDFAALSATGKREGWIDFHDPEVVQTLTKTLLKHDFGLTLSLPDDRLCPPVPVRWNYVRWIQDLLDTTYDSYTDYYDEEREVVGLDIGVGASCIYALLACSSRPEWRMAGTDIDAHSLEHAKRNVKSNDLAERIRLKQTKSTAPLIPLDEMGVEELDFIMTNPPFYSSEQDFLNSYKDPGKPTGEAPSAVCVGSKNEMICSDGDVGFVTRILGESLKLRARVQWYTAFLSKMSSLQQIVAKLKENGIENFAVTSLHPGHRTKRYAVAWSFRDLRPRNDVARHGDLVLQVLPMATANTIKVEGKKTRALGEAVNEAIEAYEGVKWVWRPLLDAGVMQCKEDVWSGKARRKRKQKEKLASLGKDTEVEPSPNGDVEGDENEVGLAVKVSCKDQEVEVRWLRGHDQILFNSFCAVLRRALTGLR
ncbi:uncharacterized protein MYCFIDRAFT_41101 [Pseudocercospora fijiensis CIRAD86]|uniref:U6 small nuclear RNA (adenine-(43)-N(6))-methyltransferase n=1 Tax=Pseudocercospora fijiensis (strain CIRAD86) TaxID=383855 RepID=M3AM68_PSEFD|nr:uncharacterized protein MYCFIDRAFT_41101 [Pseudocercospora fijiensis CIRAD86]EME85676.1 hypothetical protein MYCFIDRAFT_41101 [Pseudocercospora fijiensis CIRAD86]